MRILMIETLANDREVFVGGGECEMPDDVANQAIRAGIAVPVTKPSPKPAEPKPKKPQAPQVAK